MQSCEAEKGITCAVGKAGSKPTDGVEDIEPSVLGIHINTVKSLLSRS